MGSPRREFWFIVLLACVMALPGTILGTIEAWETAAHGVIHEVGPHGEVIIHWRDWLVVAGCWFMPVFVSVCALGAFVVAARRRAWGE